MEAAIRNPCFACFHSPLEDAGLQPAGCLPVATLDRPDDCLKFEAHGGGIVVVRAVEPHFSAADLAFGKLEHCPHGSEPLPNLRHVLMGRQSVSKGVESLGPDHYFVPVRDVKTLECKAGELVVGNRLQPVAREVLRGFDCLTAGLDRFRPWRLPPRGLDIRAEGGQRACGILG